MLRIILLPSESETCSSQQARNILPARVQTQSARNHHAILHRMDPSAAKAPSAADTPETVSRPCIWFHCSYVCIFCSLLPEYFLGQEGGGVMGNLVPALSFRDGEQYCFPLGPGLSFLVCGGREFLFPGVPL